MSVHQEKLRRENLFRFSIAKAVMREEPLTVFDLVTETFLELLYSHVVNREVMKLIAYSLPLTTAHLESFVRGVF